MRSFLKMKHPVNKVQKSTETLKCILIIQIHALSTITQVFQKIKVRKALSS